MARSADQVYRSTLNTYQNILEQFNPGLQNLVFLGTNFVRAFRMLATAANVYFVAVGKFGEQALQTSTSQILGQVLLQMTDTHRQLSNDLEVIFRRFNDEILREMDHNMELDIDYITGSKRRFEMEHKKRTESLDDATAELQRLERMRSTHARDMQEKIYNLESSMESFLKNSQKMALAEERRRYRFLAEKHFQLSHQFLGFYSKAQGTLHNKVPGWREHTSSTSSDNISGRASPRPPSMGMGLNTNDVPNADTISRRSYVPSPQPSSRELNGAELLPFSHSDHRQPGGRNPLISSDGQLSRSGSLGDKINVMNSPRVQAMASHSAGSNQTMLSFEKGAIIAILVPEAKNGWLYGKLEGTPKQGWFPCSFVRPLEEEIRKRDPSSRAFPMRSSRSAENLLDSKDYALPAADYSSNAAPVPPAPPLPSSLSVSRHSPAPPNLSRRNSATSLAVSESGRSKIFGGGDNQSELFPRGTNPFATVKLRPTVTNDRSRPLIR